MAKISRSVFTYQFVFGCNENLYKASFKGRLTEEEIGMIFQALHLCMYNNIAEAIYSCLRYSGIPFSDFKSGISVLTNESIIASTKKLLHAGSSRELQWIGNRVWLGRLLLCSHEDAKAWERRISYCRAGIPVQGK